MPKTKRPLLVVTARIPADHAEKMAWKAAENECTVAEWHRKLIADGVRGAKPPVDAQSIEVLGNPDERAAWANLAAAKQTTPAELARAILNKLVERSA